MINLVIDWQYLKEKAFSCAGLHVLWLTFSPAWLRNFVAACGLARSTVAYGGLRRRLWGLIQSIAVAAGQQTDEGDATPLYGWPQTRIRNNAVD